jgi:tetratricopeptide (TPR) repeat protein
MRSAERLRRAKRRIDALEDPRELRRLEKRLSLRLAKDPSDKQALLERGTLYRTTGAYRDAIRDLTAFVRLRPGHADAYLSMAGAQGGLGLFADALDSLNRAARLEPGNGIVRAWRGGALARLGRREEALRDLDAATTLAPGFARGWIWRGMLLHDLGRYADALRDLDRAVETDPDEEWAYAKRSLIKRRLADWRGAVEDLNQAARMNPIYDWAWSGRKHETEDKAYLEALADADRAVAAHPDFGQARAWRGQTYLKANRNREALADLDLALRLEPGFAWAWGWRGEARRRLGSPERGLEDLRRLLRRDPRYVRGYLWKASCLADLGRLREAESALRLALSKVDELPDRTSRLPDAYALLGEVLRRRGEPGPARSALDRALSNNPHCAAAFRSRALVLASLGDAAGARADIASFGRLTGGRQAARDGGSPGPRRGRVGR